ncbi:MAG: DEAD/DEAH box helicase [Nanoarchaeota archaeon]|nr:DEAD/DEAH box helicase [Nanoarchaeota archaeon]
MEEFKKLGLSDNSIKVLEKKGFTKPTSIQAKVIPLLLEGKKDIVGQSQTGTGKTASFALPILEQIKEHSKHVQAIILTPTRELALQVAQEINSLKGDKNITVLPVYGGAAIGPQRQKLKGGVDIVVGTPGRVMDLQRRRSLVLDNIQYAVLDEADEMLNMGFVEDIETILQNAPKDKKMLLFSATMPKPILNIAKKYMREYEFIEIEKTNVIIDTIEQVYYDINSKDRIEGIRRIIDYYPDFYGIIFCNTKAAVDLLTQELTKMKYMAAALHGDITQSQREKILFQLKNRSIKILIATDVAARGIHVNDLTHIINFSLPQSPEAYVHRIGRTGRAGKKGISITLVIPSEKRKLSFVERVNNCKLVKKELPSPKEIIENKEGKIKTKIHNIIEANAGKPSKYNLMAEELLTNHSAVDIISAVLKYSLNNELELNTYQDLSKIVPETGFSDSRSRSRRGDRRSPRRNDRGPSNKGDSRGRKPFSRDDDSRGRKPFSRDDNKAKKPYSRDDSKAKKPEFRKRKE